MDGIIVNSEPIHEQAFYDVMDALGYRDNHGIRFSNYVGRSDFELWRDFVALNQPKEPLEELLEMKRQRVIKVILQHEPFFDGVLALVNELHGRFALGLASGSEKAVVHTVLSLRGLRERFSVVVTAADVKDGKPAPDIFLLAAERLNVPPAECWVIEDSKPGVAAGLAAGMRVVAVTNTHGADELQHAHHVVSDYRRIGELLLGGGSAGL